MIDVSGLKTVLGYLGPTGLGKNKGYLLSTALILSIFGRPVAARSEESLTVVSVLKFSAGIATSMLMHEGAHFVVAGVTNTRMTWKVGTYNQAIGFTEHADSDAKGIAVYTAGLASQVVTSEVLLHTRVEKNDAYVRGLMAWNVINPVMYSLDYWIFHSSNKKKGNHYQGDLTGLEHYANSAAANGFAIGMTAISLYQGYRFLQTQSWAPDWLTSENKRVFVAPLLSGGFLATYNVSF